MTSDGFSPRLGPPPRMLASTELTEHRVLLKPAGSATLTDVLDLTEQARLDASSAVAGFVIPARTLADVQALAQAQGWVVLGTKRPERARPR